MAALAAAAPAPASAAPQTGWFYLDGGWRRYDDHIIAQIEQAIRDGTGEVRFTVGSNGYIINLEQMTQTNVNSGFSRAINCRWCPADSDFEVEWFWQDDDGSWKQFNDAHSAVMNELLHKDMSSADITLPNGAVYELNIEELTQTNKATGYSRRIHQQVRLTEDAAAAQPQDPDHQCPICYESRNLTAMILPCRHVLCMGCARRVQGTSNKCPMCRGPIQFIYNLAQGFTPRFTDK